MGHWWADPRHLRGHCSGQNAKTGACSTASKGYRESAGSLRANTDVMALGQIECRNEEATGHTRYAAWPSRGQAGVWWAGQRAGSNGRKPAQQPQVWRSSIRPSGNFQVWEWGGFLKNKPAINGNTCPCEGGDRWSCCLALSSGLFYAVRGVKCQVQMVSPEACRWSWQLAASWGGCAALRRGGTTAPPPLLCLQWRESWEQDEAVPPIPPLIPATPSLLVSLLLLMSLSALSVYWKPLHNTMHCVFCLYVR